VHLVPLAQDGTPAAEMPTLPEAASGIGAAYVALFAKSGFIAPWIGYYAVSGPECIGSCGFKAPPAAGRVELACFTFAEFEGHGFATQMARALIDLSRAADASLIVAARTLPKDGPSPAILRKLGFARTGVVQDPEDGAVWEWQLPR
jgi:ribosomal-protein-alanine N-acetyltransferase